MARIFSKMRISSKLPAAVAGAALVVGIGVGLASFLIGSNTVSGMSTEKLHTLAVARDHEVKNFMAQMAVDLRLYAENPATIAAAAQFQTGFSQLGQDASAYLRQSFTTNNPNPAGEKHLLDRAEGGFAYNDTHGNYHAYFRELVEAKGYYDLFIFDPKGNLVYTMFKEADYALNYAKGGGEYSDSGLGEVFRDAIGAEEGHISYVDFAPYAPSNGVAAAFIGTPILSPQGQRLGVLAFQVPNDGISELFKSRIGLGETGETILVGEDGVLRTNSTFTDIDDVAVTHFNKDIVAAAIANGSAVGITQQYRGMSMRVAAERFEFGNTRYVVAALQGVDEINAPVGFMRNLILGIGAVLVGLVAVVGALFARTITHPISTLTAKMGDLANGDLELEISGANRQDEIGEMARAVEVFKQNGIDRKRLEGQREAERHTRANRQTSIDALIGAFRETVSSALEAVSTNTNAMSATANTLTSMATDTSSQANEATNASQSASENVQSVAAAAEELAASIEEISRQVAHTNAIVNEANDATVATNEKVANLSRAAQKIGDVISLIQDIAEQTNLLALNTSIEAARAGEAGKGFAVVASEVKSLANQTATATEEISAQIADIQSSTTDAVAAIQQIAKTMGEVNSYTASIASAVEEQGAATAEISQSVAQAASGTKRVVGSMGIVTNSVSETSQSAGQVLAASEDVSNQARMLKSTIDKFLSDVAAA